jgi:outer membrane protein OmpA-like peptidoglycan-associated protein
VFERALVALLAATACGAPAEPVRHPPDCPGREAAFHLPLRYHFRTASAELDPTFAGNRIFFDAAREWMAAHPEAILRIEGHTSQDCDAERDDPRLSGLRAESVADELVRLGLPCQRLRVSALGTSQPTTCCSPAQCGHDEEEPNRRVELSAFWCE